MSKILIKNGTIINEGLSFCGYILSENGMIVEIGEGNVPDLLEQNFHGETIDAKGKLVIPGVIDDQVHFREPGLTHKGDIHSGSIAGVAGGVTSYMEMPNTSPSTTNQTQWEWKMERAAETSVANYSFYMGATNDNIDSISKLDPKRVCGVKLFMGSSTGNMLVDSEKMLSAIFAESPTLIATHCEDEATIQANIKRFRVEYGNDVLPSMHPLIRSSEACYKSSSRAANLASKYGADLHILHISTEQELSIFDAKPLEQKKITGEVCVHHLWFDERDYATKGNLIKWNPAIKSERDRDALREALIIGKLDIVATDHAPHTLEEKLKDYWQAPSGGPLLQHSLVAMIEMVNQGVFSIENVVTRMCHAPAIRYKVDKRGFLRQGYYADIVIVNPNMSWQVSKENILYKCGWSPFEGVNFNNSVETTIINGKVVCRNGDVNRDYRGMSLHFNR